MRQRRPSRRRRGTAAILTPLVLASAFAACGSDDEGLTDERGDLNEDFDSVPGATVESPALSGTAAPTTGMPPFGTVSVTEEVYPIDGFADAGGDFTACTVDPAERPEFVEIGATLDERVFAFDVVQGVANAVVGVDTTEVDDYDIDGSSVRGTAEFDAGTVVFDITC